MVTNKLENVDGKNLERNYYNKDCMDYTLLRGNDNVYTIKPGKNTLMRFYANSRTSDIAKKSKQEISILPGKLVEKGQLDKIIYALPVANGKQVKCKVKEGFKNQDNDSLRMRHLIFKMQEGDTICAIRSGVACQNLHSDLLYVYHDDGSIAIYTNIRKTVKYKGRILAGQTVGTVSKGKSNIRIFLIYLDKASLELSRKGKLPYHGYIPRFRTTDGDVFIGKNSTLVAEVNDELRSQEMTAREKRQLKKKQ